MKNVLYAVKTIAAAGHNVRFDVWSLSGNHNARARVAVMSALMGTKVPRAKSGVGAITEALYAAAGMPAGRFEGGYSCQADKEDKLSDWAFALIAKASEMSSEEQLAAAESAQGVQ